MGDSSQPAFLKKVFSSDLWRPSSSRPKALITGAALEGSSKDILDVLVGKGFEVFLSDIAAGKDVNLVWDLENKPEDRFLSSFDLVVSCSVLEHIRRPHLACQHLLDVLKTGGLMYCLFHGFGAIINILMITIVFMQAPLIIYVKTRPCA